MGFVDITLKWYVWHYNNEIFVIMYSGYSGHAGHNKLKMNLIRHSLYCGHGELTHLVVPRTCLTRIQATLYGQVQNARLSVTLAR